jgi:outer membrane protein OmpA-like peptidoglycan-associated protein
VKDELSVTIAGGVAGYSNKLNIGTKRFGYNAAFSINYMRFVNPYCALLWGAEAAQYNTSLQLKNFNSSYLKQESLEEDFYNPERLIYHTDIWKFKEVDVITSINIPFGFYFQCPLGDNSNHHFYNLLSAKLSIPIRATYKTDFTGRTYGYYFEGSQQPLYEQEDLGFFENLNLSSPKKNLDLNLSCLLSYETGFRFYINSKISMLIGAYIDFGINNIINKENQEHIVFYDNNEVNINSMLNSYYTVNEKNKNFSNKFMLMAFGLKLRFNFNLNKTREQQKPRLNSQQFDKYIGIQVNNIPKHTTNSLQIDTIKTIYIIDSIINIHINRIDENFNQIFEQQNIDLSNNDVSKSNDIQNNQNFNSEELQKQINSPNQSNNQSDYQDFQTINENSNNSHADKELTLQEKIILETSIYFDYAKYDVRQSEISILEQKLTILKAHPEIKLKISGNTCDMYGDNVNIKLGQNRAQSAKNWLLEKGISADRLITITQSKYKPQVANDNETHRKLNRRDDFEIIF